MRRTAVLALVTAVALVLPAAGLAAVGISRGANVGFPSRTFIVTLPSGMVLTPYNVHVRENGQIVSDVEVVPGRSSKVGELGVVLVIDASNSMRGAAARGALAAARAFIANRSENEVISIVTFNSGSHVILPFTRDGSTMRLALASAPPLAYGTHVYDAVATALDLLRRQHVVAGSIVVLSDGSDTGSAIGLDKAAVRARQQGVRIFSVGLHSKQYRPGPLQRLSKNTRGSYAEAATAAELKPIYADLSARLASEYLLHYTSSADAGEQVHVSVQIDGLDDVAATTYASPALAGGGSKPLYKSLREKFWRSIGSAILISILAAVLLAVSLMLVIRPRTGTLRRRMSQFVSLAQEERTDSRQSALAQHVFGGAERSLSERKWWTRLIETLELAEIRTPPAQLVLWTFLATLVVSWVFTLVVGSLLGAAVGLVVPFAVNGIVQRKVRRKRNVFADQLPDNLQVLASALRAGHSLVGALSVVVDDAPEPTRGEFQRVIADERLGVPLEDALDVVVVRMKSRELSQVALVASLQRRTGGNSAEVLDRVVETIRERAELRRLVRTLTAQGRMSRWIVSALPVFLLLAITAINPRYLAPLFSSSGGRVLLVFSALMVVLGSYVIQRIVDIKV
jgi:tight adherence protein B